MVRILLIVLFTLFSTQLANTQTVSPDDLTRRTIERRAVEAVIWGMPAVNAELMFQAMKDAKADFNQIVYWSRPADWKNQTLTPNPDMIYVLPFFNTKDVGPMVLEIPPADEVTARSPAASTMRGRRRWRMSDRPGVDKGKGGKYLILPPGYKETSARRLHRAAVADLHGLCPAALEPQERQRRRRRQGRRLRQARQVLSAVAGGKSAAETKFVDAIDVVFDSTIPYDLRFFQTLDRFVQREPWLDARQGR